MSELAVRVQWFAPDRPVNGTVFVREPEPEAGLVAEEPQGPPGGDGGDT